MMQVDPGFEWSHSLHELWEFAAAFLALGAAGFRYAALRGDRDELAGAARLYAVAARRAGVLGLLGLAAFALRYGLALPRTAARAETSIGGLLTTPGRPMFIVILLALGLLGFLLAAAGRDAGWRLALAGAVGPMVVNILSGRVGLMINSAHLLAGGLWIGTLFMLVLAGLPVALSGAERSSGGPEAALRMVRGFSPLALGAAALLVGSGVATAWRHLGGFAPLLDSPYGNTLLVKLALVSVVFALGAWNWRRGTPRAEGSAGAEALWRSARAEAVVAVLVILATAVLVTFPAPAEGPPPGGSPVPAGPPPAGR